MKRADDFERQIGLLREGGKLVDPRPENRAEVVGGELAPWALRDMARARAEAALADYRRVAGVTRSDVWALVSAVLGESGESRV